MGNNELKKRLRDQSWRDGRIMTRAELESWDKACGEAAKCITALEAERDELGAVIASIAEYCKRVAENAPVAERETGAQFTYEDGLLTVATAVHSMLPTAAEAAREGGGG